MEMIGGRYLFYLFSWIGWIMTTFLMNKSKYRLRLSFVLLMLMIASQLYFRVSIYQVHAGSFILFLVGIILMIHQNMSKFLLVLYSEIVAMIYCVFHFLIILNPSLIIFPKEYMVGIILCISCFGLTTHLLKSITILLVGSFQGEILLHFFLQEYEVLHEIGSIEYLTSTLIGTFVFILFQIVSNLFSSIGKVNQNYWKGMNGL